MSETITKMSEAVSACRGHVPGTGADGVRKNATIVSRLEDGRREEAGRDTHHPIRLTHVLVHVRPRDVVPHVSFEQPNFHNENAKLTE